LVINKALRRTTKETEMTRHFTNLSSARPLTEDQLFSVAPSIFQTEAHESRSLRFKPIPTIEVIRGLANEGFLPFKAGQSIARDPGKRDYTKHMVRFRKVDRQDLVVGDNIMELVLVNGNDGSSAYKLDAGIFRIACLNGMIVKDKDYGSVKVRHSGEAVAKVIEGSYEVLQSAERALAAPQDWGQIQLSDRERHAFARGAAIERWGVNEETNNPLSPVGPAMLLQPRRQADTGRDLWSTFNVLQENTTRGGLHGQTASGRRHTTRDVNGIDQNVKVNKGLWEMAQWLADNR
jgi:hypothetical protein